MTISTVWVLLLLPTGLIRYLRQPRQPGPGELVVPAPRQNKRDKSKRIQARANGAEARKPDNVGSAGVSLWFEAAYRAPGGLAAMRLVLFVAALLIVVTVWDQLIFLEARLGRDRASATDITGVDESGRSATYRIVLLSGEYYWKQGSTTAVVNSDGNEVALEQKLAGNGIASLLNRSSDLVAIGTASCVGGIAEEETRALDRARNLIAWLRQVPLSQSVEGMFLVNLGQYDEPCGYGPREQEQRMVIIVGVADKQPGVDVRQSFRDALERAAKGALRRLDLPGYTNWPTERFFVDVAM